MLLFIQNLVKAYGYTKWIASHSKHNFMTNKQIINAGMPDIVFENRNKEYGAYALRIGYGNRLLGATIAGLKVVFLFALLSSVNQTEKDIIAGNKKGNRL